MIDNMFILAMCGLLGLKKPVEIRIATKATKETRDCAGWYEERRRKGRVVRHVIFINLVNVVESNMIDKNFGLAEVIAHELCHAAQVENGIFDHNWHHDTRFQKLCTYLETEAKKVGYPLKKLFSPATDTD